MDLRLATLKAVSFYLMHNVSTLNQCSKFSCGTVVCKHFANYQDYPNYRWNLKNIKVIFLLADNPPLIRPCDQRIIRAFKAHYRREIWCANDSWTWWHSRFDRMPVQLQKNIPLLHALHLVASLIRVSEKTIENCFRKVDFLKQTLKHLLPKNLILQVKISINPQTACQRKNLKICLVLLTMLK
jgi:hypothetical protein